MNNLINKIKHLWSDPRAEFSNEVSQKEKEVLFADQAKATMAADSLF